MSNLAAGGVRTVQKLRPRHSALRSTRKPLTPLSALRGLSTAREFSVSSIAFCRVASLSNLCRPLSASLCSQFVSPRRLRIALVLSPSLRALSFLSLSGLHIARLFDTSLPPKTRTRRLPPPISSICSLSTCHVPMRTRTASATPCTLDTADTGTGATNWALELTNTAVAAATKGSTGTAWTATSGGRS